MSHHSKANSCHNDGQDQSAIQQQAPTPASIPFFTLFQIPLYSQWSPPVRTAAKNRLYGSNCRLTQQTNGDKKKHQGRPAALSDVELQATSQERDQVVAAVTTDSSVFWNVTPHRLCEMCRRFGDSCCIHQQVRLSTDVLVTDQLNAQILVL